MICPKCGSNNITKLSIHYQKTKKRGRSGCGCLSFVILLVFAPGLLLLMALASGVALYAYRIPLILLFIASLVASIILAIYRSKTSLCESCGYKFKTEEAIKQSNYSNAQQTSVVASPSSASKIKLIVCPRCQTRDYIPEDKLFDLKMYTQFDGKIKSKFGFRSIQLRCLNCNTEFTFKP